MRGLNSLNAPPRPSAVMLPRLVFADGRWDRIEVRGYRDDTDSWLVVEAQDANGMVLLGMSREQFIEFAGKLTQISADITRGKVAL